MDYIITDPDLQDPVRAAAKRRRAEAVASIRVTTGTGKTFDGDEKSQERLARAILASQATSQTSTTWTLADNTVATVTVAELTEALVKAGEAQLALWPLPA